MRPNKGMPGGIIIYRSRIIQSITEAVVVESGGILSHSSIITRKHNLLAVLFVTNACQLLSGGTVVLIDGY